MSSENKGKLIARGRTAEVYAWQDHQVLKLFYDWCPAPWIKHEVDIGRILVNVAITHAEDCSELHPWMDARGLFMSGSTARYAEPASLQTLDAEQVCPPVC